MRNRIKYLRRSEGYDLTQEQFAKILGISRVHLGYIERGEVIPSGMIMLKIADFFDRDPRDIFFYS
ncbi:putative transcriptional regulator [Thermoactinomyces sp. DSM 45892]|nr:putative transcriptional regulator [Thermoactinomyces sp. DSM 45892]